MCPLYSATNPDCIVLAELNFIVIHKWAIDVGRLPEVFLPLVCLIIGQAIKPADVFRCCGYCCLQTG